MFKVGVLLFCVLAIAACASDKKNPEARDVASTGDVGSVEDHLNKYSPLRCDIQIHEFKEEKWKQKWTLGQLSMITFCGTDVRGMWVWESVPAYSRCQEFLTTSFKESGYTQVVNMLKASLSKAPADKNNQKVLRELKKVDTVDKLVSLLFSHVPIDADYVATTNIGRPIEKSDFTDSDNRFVSLIEAYRLEAADSEKIKKIPRATLDEYYDLVEWKGARYYAPKSAFDPISFKQALPTLVQAADNKPFEDIYVIYINGGSANRSKAFAYGDSSLSARIVGVKRNGKVEPVLQYLQNTKSTAGALDTSIITKAQSKVIAQYPVPVDGSIFRDDITPERSFWSRLGVKRTTQATTLEASCK